MKTLLLPLLLLAPAAFGQESKDSGLDALSGLLGGPQARPIEFSKIERKIRKLPALKAKEPLYGLFLFGINGEAKAWAVLDKSAKSKKRYDVLYFDRNADGDLTGEAEKFKATIDGDRAVFDLGALKDPATGMMHKEVRITHMPESIRYRMLWNGRHVTMGCYGPTSETYAQFSPSIEKAPVFVPGTHRPFEFEHWMSGTLERGKTTSFKVFVGNRGDRRGAFSSVDDKFLAKDEYVLATLIYTDGTGKLQRYRAKLTGRC